MSVLETICLFLEGGLEVEKKRNKLAMVREVKNIQILKIQLFIGLDKKI